MHTYTIALMVSAGTPGLSRDGRRPCAGLDVRDGYLPLMWHSRPRKAGNCAVHDTSHQPLREPSPADVPISLTRRPDVI